MDKFYRAVLENTSKRKYRGGGTTTATSQVTCALCDDKSIFCLVEDIWWLYARCTSLEVSDLGRISWVKLRKKVRVDVEKIKTDFEDI